MNYVGAPNALKELDKYNPDKMIIKAYFNNY